MSGGFIILVSRREFALLFRWSPLSSREAVGGVEFGRLESLAPKLEWIATA